MTSRLSTKISAVVLGAALMMPVASYGNQWSKPKSRLKGSAIGAVAGAIVGGPVGAVAGASLGNGVQYARHKASVKHYHRHRR